MSLTPLNTSVISLHFLLFILPFVFLLNKKSLIHCWIRGLGWGSQSPGSEWLPMFCSWVPQSLYPGPSSKFTITPSTSTKVILLGGDSFPLMEMALGFLLWQWNKFPFKINSFKNFKKEKASWLKEQSVVHGERNEWRLWAANQLQERNRAAYLGSVCSCDNASVKCPVCDTTGSWEGKRVPLGKQHHLRPLLRSFTIDTPISGSISVTGVFSGPWCRSWC